MKRQMIVGVSFLALALGYATPRAQGQQSSYVPDDGVDPLTVACTYNIGGFACISTTGNVASFKDMAGAELLGASREAYALCDSAGNRFSFAGGEEGFGVPTTIRSSGTAVTIERLSADAAFKLTQVWKSDKKERDITVVNTITNLSAVARTGVKFIRTMHHQPSIIDGAAFDRSSNSGWFRKGGQRSVAVTATAMPPDGLLRHAAFVTALGINEDCTPNQPYSTPGTIGAKGNVSLPLQYLVGNLAAGKKAVVTTAYRQQ